MNILIVYDTYSGGTLDASTYIFNILKEKGHTVTLKRANEIAIDEFSTPDLTIFGTPSWFVDNIEGKPHQNFVKLMDALKTSNLQNKKMAVFGLGDETYAHFCRGVDTIEEFLRGLGGVIVTTSLKLNDYYVRQEESYKKLQTWIEQLLRSVEN